MNATPEELRHVILETLVARAPAALTGGQITRKVRRALDGQIPEAEIDRALNFLGGMRPALVIHHLDQLGTTQYWAATSDGILTYERAQAAHAAANRD